MDYNTTLKNSFRLLPFLLLFFFIFCASSVYTSANWPHINEIKSGDHKLLLQPLTTSPYTYPQTTGFSYTSAPNVIIALRSMQVDPTNLTIDFTVSITSTAPTSFTTTVLAPGIFPLTLLYYMYLTISKTYANTYFQYYSLDLSVQLNNSLTLTTSVQKTLNATITQYSQAKVVTFIASFRMGQNSSEYAVTASAVMTNTSSYSIQINSNSSLSRLQLMILIIDVYTYQIGQLNFLDYGNSQFFNSGVSYTQNFSPIAIDYFNVIVGVTGIRLPQNRAISFYLMANNLYNTATAFTYIKLQILQWRLRQCINSTKKYYALPQQYCFDNCTNSAVYTYGQNSVYFYCALCSLSCLTCAGDGVSCLTCNSNNSRSLNNSTKTCDCLIGYYNLDGYKACAVCSYTCLTCVNSSTTCTSCVSNRTLTNNSCNCVTHTYDDQTNNATCVICDYKCLNCQIASTNCTSCDAANNRIMDTQNYKCPCGSGFAQNGTAACITTPLTCASPCKSCSGVASNCTSCDANNSRVLSSNKCICKTGFTSTSITGCIQICGDGLLLTNIYQCDDGNTNNGDGCSSSCMIQSGFTCINSNSTPASTCISSSGYVINSQDLTRDTSSNQIIATIIFSPTPPKSIVPSLLNLQGYLSLNSYNFAQSSSTMTLNINILQEVTADTLNVKFTIMNQTVSIPLKTSNKLQLKPYSSFELSFYSIQIYLIWIFIGLLWLGSIIFVLFIDAGSFNGVFELFMFVALAWVAVEGQQLYSLLFVPLKNLRYIFGANLQLSNEENLFSVFNIGCIMFALPLIGFGIIVLINKKNPYAISTKIKRFVLFDLLYGWLMVNAFLIAYGIAVTTKGTKMMAIDIGGIVFGVIYLLACFIISWKFFTKKKEVQINPRLQISKKNLFRPRLYSLTVNLYIVFAFIYLILAKYIKINAIFMIGLLFLMFLFFALGNILINKVKYMINLVILLFIYGCVMLYNNVGNAVWSGLAVTVLLYLQLAINFTFFIFEKSKRNGSSRVSDQVKGNYESNMIKLGVNLERQAEFDPMEQSQNKSALQGQYENHFTVYQPTIKKHNLQIMVPAPQMLRDTNAVQTAMKAYTSKSQKERLMLDKRVNGLAAPRQRRQREMEEILDISGKEVEMDAI